MPLREAADSGDAGRRGRSVGAQKVPRPGSKGLAERALRQLVPHLAAVGAGLPGAGHGPRLGLYR